MDVRETSLEGPLLIEPEVFEDERGYFFESFNEAKFRSKVSDVGPFVQDNQSGSIGGVLRGLHYQLPPEPQGKLVRCLRGAVWDVAVDVRRSSPSFGGWFGVELSEGNRNQYWIPGGFAHGFLSLTSYSELAYKVTAYYSPAADRSIRWDDPELDIDWPLDSAPLLSTKDADAPFLAEADVFP